LKRLIGAAEFEPTTITLGGRLSRDRE